MNEKTNNALNGINILKKAKKHNGEFILGQLNSEITKIIKAIRNSPSKGGSRPYLWVFNNGWGLIKHRSITSRYV